MPEFARLVIERMSAMQESLDAMAEELSRAGRIRPVPTPPMSPFEALGKRLARSAPSEDGERVGRGAASPG